MDIRRQSSPARVAAVLALVVGAIVLVVVVSTSIGGDSSEQLPGSEPQQHVRLNKEGKPQERYIVKPGDTLSTIAEKVHVPVEELQRLNPGIDPQALGSGARVKIR
jgi:LysM repeat protein